MSDEPDLTTDGAEVRPFTDEDLQAYFAGGVLEPVRVQCFGHTTERVLTADEAATILEDFKRLGPRAFKWGDA